MLQPCITSQEHAVCSQLITSQEHAVCSKLRYQKALESNVSSNKILYIARRFT